MSIVVLMGSLFRKLYRSEGIEMILRPGCKARHSRYEGVYKNLYPDFYRFRRSGHERITTGEMIQSLKVLAEGVNVEAILLLGSHGDESKDAEAAGTAGLPSEVLERLASEVRRAVTDGNAPGYSDSDRC